MFGEENNSNLPRNDVYILISSISFAQKLISQPFLFFFDRFTRKSLYTQDYFLMISAELVFIC